MVKFRSDEEGVSVIVGALLLILITVIAAAGLAMIVSQAEKQQADRQALQQAVDNEKLKIVSIKPAYDPATGNLISVDLNVQNLNIDESRIVSVSVNNDYAGSFESDGAQYNFSNRLTVRPSSNVSIRLEATKFISPANIKNTDPITIQVVTSYVNYFTRTIKPPDAVMKVSVESEDLGVVHRDYLLLDGSGSSSETGQIVSYKWTVGGYPAFINPRDYYGKVVRVNPDTNGPLMVRLEVVDDSMLYGNTSDNPLTIPEDPNFNPPAALEVVKDTADSSLNATVRDTSMRPVPGVVVNFLVTVGNLILGSFSSTTDAAGNANVTIVNGSGTVQVISGGLDRNIAWP